MGDRITTRKVGGIWHGYLEGHPEIDERGLTEEVAKRKVERIVDKMRAKTRFANSEAEVLQFPRGKR